MDVKAQILDHLQRGRTLTSAEAFMLYGTLKLTSRISELRREGYSIHSDKIRTLNGKYVNEYRML